MPIEHKAQPAKVERTSLPPLPVHSWQMRKEHRPRQWVILTLPFREAIQVVEPRYYDFAKDAGEQRPVIDSWVNKLRKEMEKDAFAPASWSACLRVSQKQKSVFNEDGTVTIHVGNSPIPLEDGNHRGQAMLKDYAMAQKNGDQETVELIENCDITILIYLEPERSQQTFRALQEGKRMSPDLLALRDMRNKNASPEQSMSLRVAMELNVNKDSHLFGKVNIEGPAPNMIGVRVATTSSSSELSCSIMGGVRIALAFKKKDEWLQQCYVEAWDAIQHATEQTGLNYSDQPMSGVLVNGSILCPLGHPGGKKGGTTLITGIGNMWAYMKAVKGLDTLEGEERQHLASTVDEVFDVSSSGGLGAPYKRVLMGKFAKIYFESILLEDDEKPRTGMVRASHGIPAPLMNDLMSPGAFGPKEKEEAELASA